MPISWRGTLQQYVGRLHRFMTINAKSLFMTTSMAQYPYCPPCIPSVSGAMRPWDTKF
jgi:hypothetical protein